MESVAEKGVAVLHPRFHELKKLRDKRRERVEEMLSEIHRN